MIVKKPIGAVKANGTINRLTVGKPVPAIVLEFWKKSGQLNDLIKSGAIQDDSMPEKKEIKKDSESIFKTGK